MIYVGLRIVLGLLLNLVFALAALDRRCPASHRRRLRVASCRTWPETPAGESRCAADLPPAVLDRAARPARRGGPQRLATLLFRWRKEGWERFFIAWATRLILAAAALAVVLVGMPYLVEWLATSPTSGDSAKPSAIGDDRLYRCRHARPARRRLRPARHTCSARKTAAEATGKTAQSRRQARLRARGWPRLLAAALVGPLLLLAVVGLAVAVGHVRSAGGRSPRLGLIGSAPRCWLLFAVIYALRRPDHLVAAPVLQAAPQQRLRAQAGEGGGAATKGARPGRGAGGAGADGPPTAGDDGIAVERDYDELVPLSQTALKEEAAKSRSGRRCSSARRRTSPIPAQPRRAAGSPASPSAPTRSADRWSGR